MLNIVALSLVFVGSAMASAGLIWLLQPLWRRYALAKPNSRSSHKMPTPQGGGIAVIAVTAGHCRPGDGFHAGHGCRHLASGRRPHRRSGAGHRRRHRRLCMCSRRLPRLLLQAVGRRAGDRGPAARSAHHPRPAVVGRARDHAWWAASGS